MFCSVTKAFNQNKTETLVQWCVPISLHVTHITLATNGQVYLGVQACQHPVSHENEGSNTDIGVASDDVLRPLQGRQVELHS